MRDYAKISTTIWHSEKFRSLDGDDARLAYLYLHTCSHVNSVGCFRLREAYAADDLCWDLEAFRKAIETLSKGFLIGFDVVAKGEMVVRIEDYLRFDPFTNPNTATGAVKLALALPECEQKRVVLQELITCNHVKNTDQISNALGTLSKPFRTPEPEPEPEPEKEIDGGGEAQAREIEIIEPKTDREKILTAIGVDPVSGLTGHGGRMIGTRADMQRVTRWSELGLTIEDQCAVIREVMAKRNGQGPPNGFKFFDKPMERLAGEKLAPQLEPINLPQRPTGAVNGKSSREQFDIAHREYARRISEGTIERGPDPSDPFAR